MNARPEDLLPIRREATLTFRFVRLVGGPLVRLVFRVRFEGRENIPRGACVIIANHLNWLDSFLILLAFPAEPRVHFLAEPELLMKRRLQWWIVRHAAGYVAVHRGPGPDRAMFERVDRCLRIGAIVGIYPEGNYGRAEGTVMPFKRGFAHFALQAGVPVVPVALSGTRELWLRKRVRLVIGKPIAPDGLDVTTLVERGESAVKACLPPYAERAGPKPLRKLLTNLF